MTYSIVALDRATGELGVAVQTRWFNVGAWVPWVEPGVGAVATQSFTEPAYGPKALALMRDGVSAPDALARLLADDPQADLRQIGFIDAAGRTAAHTGARCVRFASHIARDGVAVQSNMMERSTVPEAMLRSYDAAVGDLADRMLAAMRAAEAEGGDIRGRQSAALIVGPGPDAAGERAKPWLRAVDLRVDDHPDPVGEIGRLLGLARAYAAMDEAERASLGGDEGAASAARARSIKFAPDDDQVVLWSAVGLALAGRREEARAALAAARFAEPRSDEHLRRFAEAGHLPGGEETLRRLGLA